MKDKFLMPLLILGGLITVYCPYKDIPAWLVATVGAFALGASIMCYTAVYGATVWGIKIKASAKGNIIFGSSILGLVIGGYSIVYMIIAFIGCIGTGKFTEFFIYLAMFVVIGLLSMSIAKILLEKSVAFGTNYASLNPLPIFDEIDKNLADAQKFVVSFEGVALINNANYCYAVYFYEDYQLGSLTTVNEVALVGGYFCQRYSDRYTFKVDMEKIPGEPGQSKITIDGGGIEITHTPGTYTQLNFRSYIFHKK